MRYISKTKVKEEPRGWVGFRVGPQRRWLSELHSQTSPHLTHRCYTSLEPPGPSRVRFWVSDVFLDPVLTGVSTDLPTSLDLETAEKGRKWSLKDIHRGPLYPSLPIRLRA